MAIEAADRAFVNANHGHIERLVAMFFENARSPGDSTLSLALALGEDGLGSLTPPTGCTKTELINSFKDFVDEIQS